MNSYSKKGSEIYSSGEDENCQGHVKLVTFVLISFWPFYLYALYYSTRYLRRNSKVFTKANLKRKVSKAIEQNERKQKIDLLKSHGGKFQSVRIRMKEQFGTLKEVDSRKENLLRSSKSDIQNQSRNKGYVLDDIGHLKGAEALKKPYEIDASAISLKEEIGVGSFGSVFRGEWLGTEVAVKKPHRNIPPEMREKFFLEVDLMAKLHHPNIVIFMAACLKEPDVCLVLEYLPRGNMHEFLRNKENVVTIKLVLKFAVDIARGMKYLHHRLDIIQRDLKPSNLLIDDSYNVKICDFGLSRYLSTNERTLTYCGTPFWTAPEVILQDEYDEKADVFSFSIILWELVTRDQPYEGRNEIETAIAVATEYLRPKIPPFCPQEIQNLMQEGWSHDPRDRPDFQEILDRLVEIKRNTAMANNRLRYSSISSASPAALGMDVELDLDDPRRNSMARLQLINQPGSNSSE